MTRRALNVLADNSLLVLVFCAVGALVLLAFAPARVVADTWMTLVAGREIVDHGLPHVDNLTINGAGRTWTDQQWLAHLVLYGSERLGGFGFLTFFTGLSVMLAYAVGLVAVRARGATTRATLVVFMVVAFAASWTWTVRAQVLVLPLFAAVVVLAVDARDGLRRRSWLMIPILVLWGNLHGSASLGAVIASAVGVLELVRRRHAVAGARLRCDALARAARDAVQSRRDRPVLPARARRPTRSRTSSASGQDPVWRGRASPSGSSCSRQRSSC